MVGQRTLNPLILVLRQRRIRLRRRILITRMYSVYVLKSLNYKTRYVGNTKDVKKRLAEHNTGRVRYTKGRRPWRLVYLERYNTRASAVAREKFLKSGQGRKFLDQHCEVG